MVGTKSDLATGDRKERLMRTRRFDSGTRRTGGFFAWTIFVAVFFRLVANLLPIGNVVYLYLWGASLVVLILFGCRLAHVLMTTKLEPGKRVVRTIPLVVAVICLVFPTEKMIALSRFRWTRGNYFSTVESLKDNKDIRFGRMNARSLAGKVGDTYEVVAGGRQLRFESHTDGPFNGRTWVAYSPDTTPCFRYYRLDRDWYLCQFAS
jgi:hypothetical protein